MNLFFRNIGCKNSKNAHVGGALVTPSLEDYGTNFLMILRMIRASNLKKDTPTFNACVLH